MAAISLSACSSLLFCPPLISICLSSSILPLPFSLSLARPSYPNSWAKKRRESGRAAVFSVSRATGERINRYGNVRAGTMLDCQRAGTSRRAFTRYRATDNNNCFDSHGNWIAAAGIIKGLFTVVVTPRRYYKFNLSLIGRRAPRPGPVSRNVPPLCLTPVCGCIQGLGKAGEREKGRVFAMVLRDEGDKHVSDVYWQFHRTL